MQLILSGRCEDVRMCVCVRESYNPHLTGSMKGPFLAGAPRGMLRL